MKLKIVLCVFLVTISFSVFAQDQVDTGIDLLRVCENGMDKIKNPDEIPSSIMSFSTCYSYVTGFWQGYLEQLKIVYNVSSANQIKDKNIRNKMFCPAYEINSITGTQLMLVVIKYLKNHPEQLNYPQNFLVYSAFLQAFPCNN